MSIIDDFLGHEEFPVPFTWKSFLALECNRTKEIWKITLYISPILFLIGVVTGIYFYKVDIVTIIVGSIIATLVLVGVVYISTVILAFLISRLYKMVSGEELPL